MTDRVLSKKPSEIVWQAQPALSGGAEHAVLLGDPAKPGRYAFRLRVPAGHRALPHWHPDERTYTVLSGTFFLGFGHDGSDDDLESYPEGSIVIVRADRLHFQLAKSGPYLVQVEGEGPTAVEYENPKDDPRISGPP